MIQARTAPLEAVVLGVLVVRFVLFSTSPDCDCDCPAVAFRARFRIAFAVTCHRNNKSDVKSNHNIRRCEFH